jgi:hypothetical protein
LRLIKKQKVYALPASLKTAFRPEDLFVIGLQFVKAA